jgi:hypothetical protein
MLEGHVEPDGGVGVGVSRRGLEVYDEDRAFEVPADLALGRARGLVAYAEVPAHSLAEVLERELEVGRVGDGDA